MTFTAADHARAYVALARAHAGEAIAARDLGPLRSLCAYHGEMAEQLRTLLAEHDIHIVATGSHH